MKRSAALIILFCFSIFGCEGDYTIYDMHPPETVIVEVEVPVEVPVEVIVEVEVPVEVPGDGGDVWIDSFDQPYVMEGIDIVWLIDQSGSMNSHAQSVIDGIESMMLALPATGWRLGIATTAYFQTQSTQDFPLVPGDTVQNAWDYYNALPSQSQEAGFDALYSYIVDNTYNQSWLRPNAGLLVVFVSDEEEQSTRDFPYSPGLQNFINWYGGLRPSVFMASIVNVHQTENDCVGNVGPLDMGQRYMDATNAFGGVVIDICSEDWAPGVQAATNQVEPHTEWELTYTPIEDTLIVFVDSVEISDLDWTYNSITNHVEFIVIPPEGTLVEIGYVIDYDLGDDDDSAAP